KVVTDAARLLLVSIISTGNDRGSGIPMGHQLRNDHKTDGQLGLQSNPAETAACPRVARREQQAQPRGEGKPGVSVPYQLVAIIQGKVADAGTRSGKGSGMLNKQRVT